MELNYHLRSPFERINYVPVNGTVKRWHLHCTMYIYSRPYQLLPFMYGMSIIPLIYSLFFIFFPPKFLIHVQRRCMFDRRLLELIPQFIHADICYCSQNLKDRQLQWPIYLVIIHYCMREFRIFSGEGVVFGNFTT